MKPLRIEIVNLGAIAYVDIDLRNITTAAIAGPNGAGKSTAFTIAPRFALFGATKDGTSVDDMVRSGETEASVTYEFEHQGDVWRVVRTRSTKGRGKSTLELQRRSGALWVSESGASIAETQKKIIDLLNLDDDTFSASSMILQGDAGNFTKRPAGQRKAILAQILQLGQYEALQEKARARAAEANVQIERIKAQIAAIDERLANQTSLEGDKLVAETKLRSLEKQIKQAEVDLQAAQVDLAALQARINQIAELAKRIETLGREVNLKTMDLDVQQRRRETAQQVLAKEPDVLEAVAEYDGLREQITVLKTQDTQRQTVATEGQRLKDEMDQIDLTIEKAGVEISRITTQLEGRQALLDAKAEYDAAVRSLDAAEKNRRDYDALQQQLQKANTELSTANIRRETEMASRQKEIDFLLSKTAMLDNAKCIDIERATCKFVSDAKEAKSKAQRLKTEAAAWHAEALTTAETMKFRVTGIQSVIDNIGYDPATYTELQKKISDLRSKAEAAGKLDGMAKLLETLKAQLVENTERRDDIEKRLADMREQYRVLSEGMAELPEKTARLAELQHLVDMKDRLPAAREMLTTAADMITKLTTDLKTSQNQLSELKAEHDNLFNNAEPLRVAAQEKANNLQATLNTYRAEQTSLTASLGGIQAKLDAMNEAAEQRKVLAAELDPLAKRFNRWQTLVKAFGRDGIQALILENAVPELERTANEILGQMSGGRNYLRFETQKELKSRSGMAETLDIIVGDWSGERIYETYSGGEQLRIDFAIRFALAEMLAKRAGAKVDWLTIDEGFGSQSDEFLPMVIEAVQNVANRFGMVLVISHVKAVQEAFGEKIEFRPATESSGSAEVCVA